MRFKCKCDGFLYKSLELYDITPDTIQTDDVSAQNVYSRIRHVQCNTGALI